MRVEKGMNQRILGLALPNIVTNITVPLLGMVDMAIVGHLSGDHIGAIAIGTQIFNLIYWNFGFLRMGTSGLTAQAFGAEKWHESIKILIRACAIALAIALLIIIMQWPISLAVPHIFNGSHTVIGLALTYFFVRVWAAPATLGLYAIKGWFIGMQDSKTPMWIAIALNCVNIVASLLFVLVLKWDIFGVALGTVIANYSGLALGIIFLRRRLHRDNNLSVFRFQLSVFKEALHWDEMKRFFKVNGDIFLRTLCLSGVFTFITAASSHMSDQILAIDALLLQFFTLFSYIMDGFAYAGESLVGRHIGARQLRHLKLAVRLLIFWGMALTVVFTGLYAAFGNQILHVFTDQQEVIAAAGDYMGWVLVIPICGFAAFLFDGIFIGATATRTMRNAMFVATAAFFAIYYGLKEYYGTADLHVWNNILWIAFMVFLILRGLLQALRVRKDIYRQVGIVILLFIFHFSFFNSATAQNVGYTDHSGTVVDVKTGKPLANAKVTHAIGGQTDEKGRFTVRYYNNESDRQVIISHPGYYTDTFSYAPTFVSLRRMPSQLIRQNRPKIAVVLSGGGAKGVAHISALRAIEEAGLPIDIICGTSMGALIGGLYSIGWSTGELDSLVRHQDWSFLLTDKVKEEELDIDTRRDMNTYPLWHAFSIGSKKNEGAGVFRGYNLDQLFNRLLEGYLDSLDFNDLPIPFACVATDIITNTEIDFHSGFLKQAMRASMSIPGVFAPVRMGNMLLVDGGMRNNYPADIARKMGADIIIGVTVQDDTLSVDDIKGPVELLMQIIDINCKNKYNENLAMSDILMQVDVDGYSAASFTAASIDTLLRRGAEEADRHKEELLALQKKMKAEYGNWVTTIYRPERSLPESNDNKSFKLTAPNPALSSPRAGVTFRFDNEETGALQIGAQYPFYWHVPMEISSRLRLGKRLQFFLEHKFYPRGFTSPSLNYDFHRNDIDIYDNGVRTYNIKYSQHIFKFTPLNSRFRSYKINAGLRFDYFDYFDPILSANYNAIVLDNQRFFSYFFQSLLNTENDYYFPTTGSHFQIDVSFHTDNLVSFNGKPGIPEVALLWHVSASPSDRFTLQPGVFSRMILSDEVPLAYINCLGADQKIVEQQLEFPGIHSLVQVDRYLVGLNLNLQYMFTNKHYILLRSAAARCVDQLTDFIPTDFRLTDPEFFYGISLGYAYKSFLGPIKALFGFSSLSPSINLYISIGHNF